MANKHQQLNLSTQSAPGVVQTMTARPVVEWFGKSRPEVWGTGFVPVELLTDTDIQTLVEEHLESLDPSTAREETCPLFGGILLTINGEIVLEPQCCADLSECWCWFELHEDSGGRYLGVSGHPQPYVDRCGETFFFLCHEPDSPFTPDTKPAFSVPAAELLRLLDDARRIVEAFERRLAVLFCDSDFARNLVSGGEGVPTDSGSGASET